jgi:uncharacterized protein (DUF433 family)
LNPSKSSYQQIAAIVCLPRHRFGQPFVKAGAVGQAGQRVGVSALAQRLFAGVAFGDVLEHTYHCHWPPVDQLGLADAAHPPRAAVGSEEVAFEIEGFAV